MSKFSKNYVGQTGQFFRTIGFTNRFQSEGKVVFSVKDGYTSEEIFDIYFRLADEYEYVQNRFLSELFIELGIRAELTATVSEADEAGFIEATASELCVYVTYDGHNQDEFARKVDKAWDILLAYLKSIKPEDRPFKIALR